MTFLFLPVWAFAQNQFLMTVGGYSGLQDGCQHHCPSWDKKVTLLSLDPDVQVPECLQRLNDFQYLEGACMSNLLGDQPHICAGWAPFGDGYNDKCYHYDPILDLWTESGTLSVTRREGNGCAFSYAHGMIVAGGYGCTDGCVSDPPGPLTTVEYTSDGQRFGQLADLPEAKQFHCLVALWGGDLFSTGGQPWEVTEKAYIYSNSKNEWSQVADMITPRCCVFCGVALTRDGSQQEVVAAGGVTDLGKTSDAVEIYSIRDGYWKSANPLPSPIMEATSVPYDNSFLIVGGVGDLGQLSDLIYRYDTGKDSWVLLDARLPTAASFVAASMVNSYIFPSCDSE